MELIIARPEGLYCPPGDFYVDPWRPVDRAVITHGHGDHARWGSRHYLAARPGEGILRRRLGAEINLDTLPYGESIDRIVEGLVATFRYSWLHQDGSPQIQTDLRAILNYNVRF